MRRLRLCHPQLLQERGREPGGEAEQVVQALDSLCYGTGQSLVLHDCWAERRVFALRMDYLILQCSLVT